MPGIIVGGGIVGLATALTLHRAGIRVTVFEQAAEIRELGVGLNLLPHSVKHLLDLGLQAKLDANAVRTAELRFFCRNGKAIWQEPRGLDAGYDVPQYSIHRGRLQAILRDAVIDRLGADSIRTGHTFANAIEHGDSVTAEFGTDTGPVRESAEFLIGADGINSVVRQAFYPGEGPPHFAGLMLWRGATLAPSFMTGRSMFMAGHNHQKVVVYPITNPDADGRQLINWVAELRVPEDTIRRDDWHSAGRLDEFAAEFAGWTFGDLRVSDLFAGADNVYKFPMVDRDPLPRWSFGRMTLAGDAAHAMYPNGSNGASQGILDAVALARHLSAGRVVPTAFADYEQERLGPTGRLVLDNRQTGPERVLQYVEERCPGTCGSSHTCIPAAELEEVATAYKRLAGFDRLAVNVNVNAGGH